MSRLDAVVAPALLLTVSPWAGAETPCREITSLPTKLSEPGMYCLTRDLAMPVPDPMGDRIDAAIEIEDDDVTLDCGGHEISGIAFGLGTAIDGITSDGFEGIRIQNCRIRSFWHGISLVGGLGHRVEDNQLEGNRGRSIQVLGREDSVVRNNTVLDTGGSDSAETIGIAAASGTDVIGNRIVRVSAVAGNPADAIGISIHNRSSDQGTSRVADNRIEGVSAHVGRSIGILTASIGIRIEDNAISLGGPQAGSVGILTEEDRPQHMSRNYVSGAIEDMHHCSLDGHDHLEFCRARSH